EAYWDEWTEWKCMEPCDLDKMFRFRKCYHKKELKISELCQGLRTEDMPANCKNRCAQACPLGKWRKDCQGDCSNCEDDCNKLTGYCARCKPGFQNNNMSCSDVCGPDKYGFMCQSQCSIKCNGEDCVERVTGSCPERSNVMWLTLLLLLFPPIMILLFLRYKHIQAGREDPLAFIVESPSNLGVTASKKSLGTSRSKQSMKSTKSKPSMRSLATGLDGKKKEKRANTSDTTGSEVN
ncbi:tumor necrosis factor receptorsuperfamily member 6, partial [Biomphalaria glabrata]